jgi:hypothetical protein
MILNTLRSTGLRSGLTVRSGLTAAVAATALLAMPAESHAIFNWLSRCCGGGGATPTYGAAPLYGAAAPADPCCAPPQVTQTANYVPQTCYRTQYVTVPVTTYRPVVGRDPCTGCPVTCMRPATTLVQQARLVPYTTYRMVLSNPCCGGAATAAYAPGYATGMGYAPAASCSGCSGAAAPISYAAPAGGTPYYGGATSGTIISSTDPAASAPTLAPPPAGSSGNSTFVAPAQKVEKPIPADDTGDENDSTDDKESDSGKASGTGGTVSPRLFQPNDRTTSNSILRAGTRPVVYREPTPPPSQKRPIDDGGWRPSTR